MKKYKFDKSVKFDPFVGSNYETGFNNTGIKILVLGDSVYFPKNSVNEIYTINGHKVKEKDFSIYWLREGIFSGKTSYTQFWVNIVKILSKTPQNNPSVAERRERFNSIAYYNYSQFMLERSRTSPTDVDFKKSAIAFISVLKNLKPDLVLCLGHRLWDHLPDSSADKSYDLKDLIKENKIDYTWIYEVDHYKSLILRISHPSSFGFAKKIPDFNKTIVKVCNAYLPL